MRSLRDLHPASFAPAMATGIAAIDCDLNGLTTLSRALVGINVVIFGGTLAKAFRADVDNVTSVTANPSFGLRWGLR